MGLLIVVLACVAWVGVCQALNVSWVATMAGAAVIGWAVARLG